MASQVTTTSPNASSQEIYTSGTLLPFRSLKIAPDGELLVKGQTLFLGYKEGEQITNPIDDLGWYHTGDLGKFDAQGFLSVWGRKDNMFISGGENIYPEQIENAIQLHPDIHQVLVVPVFDHKFGQRPVAFIDAGQVRGILQEIEAFLEGKLPRYMYPIAYFDWEDAPERVGIKDSRKEFAAKAKKLLNGGD